MQKCILIGVLILLTVVSGAMAATVGVDFTGLTADITNNPYWINGVTFSYTPISADTAAFADGAILSNGIGLLTMVFDFPAIGLDFDFSVLGVPDLPSPNAPYQTGDVLSDGFAFFNSGDSAILFATISGQSTYTPPECEETKGCEMSAWDADGTFHYAGPGFSQADVYFQPTAAYFDVKNVSYDPAPEPGTIVLFACGLAIVGARRTLKRS